VGRGRRLWQRRELNVVMYEVYGLGEEEIAIVEGLGSLRH